MQEGVELMQKIFHSYAEVGITGRGMQWNTDLLETLELENLLAQAQTIIAGALNREESRGGHAREDFPDRDDKNWMKHTLAWLGEGNGEGDRERDGEGLEEDIDNEGIENKDIDNRSGKVRFDYRPVHMYTLTDDCEVIPPKKRVY